MSDPLHELQTAYTRLCRLAFDSEVEFSFQTEPQHDGSPHVEFSNGKYHYVVTERGLELERRSTDETDEILFWMISDITFWSGVEFELRNRVEGQDSRRIIFAKWRRLMARCGASFTERLEKQIEKTLRLNPYNDQ